MTTPTRSRTGDTDDRRYRGRQREGASFPVGPSRARLPADYTAAFAEIEERIRKERLRVVLAANAGLVLLYWDVGRAILDRQGREGWGARVIDRLSQDLRGAFPDMRGLSSRNLGVHAGLRRRLAGPPNCARGACTNHLVPLRRSPGQGQGPGNLPLVRPEGTREGWSRNVLVMQIEAKLHERTGKAITNFPATLPPEDSDLATQVFKDPYLFDFLGTAARRTEREIEQALVNHVQRFLLELGTGFAFVGRQVLLEVGDQDFYADLLFYHLKLRRYVVELKAVPFSPAFVGQMNLYLSAVDDLLRHADDKPTIGLLLCKSKDRLVVEYALRGLDKPMGVAEWETRLVESLPDELKGSLPSVEEIERELNGSGDANA